MHFPLVLNVEWFATLIPCDSVEAPNGKCFDIFCAFASQLFTEKITNDNVFAARPNLIEIEHLQNLCE